MLEIMGHEVLYYDDTGHRDMMSAVEHYQPELLLAAVENTEDLESLHNLRCFSSQLMILPIVRNMNHDMFTSCHNEGFRPVLSNPVLFVELEKIFCVMSDLKNSQSPEEISILDKSAFLDVMRGGGDKAVGILESFCRDCETSITGVQTLLQEDPANHREEIREISHRLKGSAGMFAFRALQREMEDLELRASGSDPIQVETDWNKKVIELLFNSQSEAMALLAKV